MTANLLGALTFTLGCVLIHRLKAYLSVLTIVQAALSLALVFAIAGLLQWRMLDTECGGDPAALHGGALARCVALASP